MNKTRQLMANRQQKAEKTRHISNLERRKFWADRNFT